MYVYGEKKIVRCFIMMFCAELLLFMLYTYTCILCPLFFVDFRMLGQYNLLVSWTYVWPTRLIICVCGKIIKLGVCTSREGVWCNNLSAESLQITKRRTFMYESLHDRCQRHLIPRRCQWFSITFIELVKMLSWSS